MPLDQLISSVPGSRKDLRQRQHILILIEDQMTAALTRVRLGGLYVHHNSRPAFGTRYLDNGLTATWQGSNYITARLQGGICDGKRLRHLEVELIHYLSVARN